MIPPPSLHVCSGNASCETYTQRRRGISGRDLQGRCTAGFFFFVFIQCSQKRQGASALPMLLPGTQNDILGEHVCKDVRNLLFSTFGSLECPYRIYEVMLSSKGAVCQI